MADTGFLSPGTGSNDASVGSLSWTNPENITSSDNVYATISVESDSTSNYLVGSNFGFSIPSGATIDGIEASIERALSGPGTAVDNIVRIMKGGVIGGDNKAVGGSWGSSETPQAYGGASDLWGNTLTAEDVNASDFGLVMSGSFNTEDGFSVRADHFLLKIYYTATGWTGEVNGVSNPAKVNGVLAANIASVMGVT